MNLTSTFTLLQPYSLGFSTIYELNHLLHCWWGIWSGPDIAKVVFIVAKKRDIRHEFSLPSKIVILYFVGFFSDLKKCLRHFFGGQG